MGPEMIWAHGMSHVKTNLYNFKRSFKQTFEPTRILLLIDANDNFSWSGESWCGAQCCWIHHQHVYFDSNLNDHLDPNYIHELGSYEKTTVEGNYSLNNQFDGPHALECVN